MISVQQSDIPDYLLNSAFYLSLDKDEGNPEAIQIPERCFKKNDEVENLEDFGQLLHTMQFWDVSTIPEKLIKYLDSTDYNVWYSTAEDILDPMSPMLTDLTSVFRNSSLTQKRFLLATEAGRCELLEYWLKTGKYSAKHSSSLPKETDIAAKDGWLHCLQLLNQYHFICDRLTANEAARSGSLECLHILRDNNCPCDNNVLNIAAEYGHLHILEYAHQQGLVWDSGVCLTAAREGHLSCLRYAHEHGCPWSSEVTSYAAYYGHFDCLKYALEHGCELTYDASLHAAAGGHLHCLKLLCDFGTAWHADLPSTAASYGHLHILQYLHESGVEWSEQTVYEGTNRNHLVIVQYAISLGCDWNKQKCTSLAVSSNYTNIDMVSYLLSLWTPSETEMRAFTIEAAQNLSDVSVLRYLVEEQHQDITNDPSVFTAAQAAGSIYCVKYCFEKGCRQVDYDNLCAQYSYYLFVDSLDLDKRILECVQYLVEQGWEIPDRLVTNLQRFKVKLPDCKAFCSARKVTTPAGPSKRAKLL